MKKHKLTTRCIKFPAAQIGHVIQHNHPQPVMAKQDVPSQVCVSWPLPNLWDWLTKTQEFDGIAGLIYKTGKFPMYALLMTYSVWRSNADQAKLYTYFTCIFIK